MEKNLDGCFEEVYLCSPATESRKALKRRLTPAVVGPLTVEESKEKASRPWAHGTGSPGSSVKEESQKCLKVRRSVAASRNREGYQPRGKALVGVDSGNTMSFEQK